MPSREGGPRSPEEMGLEPKEKPKREIKVIKKGEVPVKKLDLSIENFEVAPDQKLNFEEASKPVEAKVKQSDMDWAEDFRAQVKLKAREKLTAEEKAREDFKRLFGEKE